MLEIINISKKYKKETALDNINLSIDSSTSIALIGESGSGKTTLCKLILDIEKPSSGKIIKNIPKINIVFQDYRSSVNPLFKVKQILREPFWLEKKIFNEIKLNKFLEELNLLPNILDKFPHELSGGQLQRVCILRAILGEPSFLILDEALNALDIFTKDKVITFLKRLKKEENLNYFLITHDLQVASALCDEIKILKKGKIIESLKINSLKKAQNSYTKELINSVIFIKEKNEK